MADAVVPIPLRTTQALAAHPFYTGAAAQTRRTSNLWVDERQRLRRRPALHKIGDNVVAGVMTGMFNYRYQSRTSKILSSLIGVLDPLDHSSSSTYREPSSFLLSDKEFSFSSLPATSGEDGVRLFVDSPTNVYSAAGVEFIFSEPVAVREGGTTGSDGTLRGYYEVVADNLDYTTPVGSIILRGVSGDSVADLDGSLRLTGQASGANVRFTAGRSRLSPRHKRLWLGSMNSSSERIWSPLCNPDFIQFGKIMLQTDDSNLYPIRVWTGGYQSMGTLQASPRGSFFSVHQNRIWIGGLQESPHLIVGCGLDEFGFADPYDWDTENIRVAGAVAVPVSADDQDAVTGMARSFFGDLIVFKSNSTHRISGAIFNDLSSDFALPFSRQTVSRTIGCASHRSIQQVGNDILWMSEKGVHSLRTTQEYGDVKESYLTFPIADLWEEINHERTQHAQSVYIPRLGLYMLGIPTKESRYMNKLLAFSVVSKQWQIWDVGSFSSISIGPRRGLESDSVYIYLVTDTDNDLGKLAVLNFDDQTDWDQTIDVSSITNTDFGTSTAITTKIEPGDLFVESPEIRFRKKSIDRIQFYINSPGNMDATVKYSWDGGDEDNDTISLNPNREKAFGNGYALGDNWPGNALGDDDTTATTSFRPRGSGHTFRMRIEDSNTGRLAYLEADAAVSFHDTDYSPSTRDN